MSTTWVFLGVIGGREIAISLARTKKGKKHRKKAGRMIFRDFSSAMIGLFVSIALAAGANAEIRNAIGSAIKGLFN